MKLYIDTTSGDKIIIKLNGESFEEDARIGKSQKLLPFIDRILSQKSKTVKDLAQIEVNTGSGSFTGIRVGVAVAQTLGWFLKIPVNGKNIEHESIDIKYF